MARLQHLCGGEAEIEDPPAGLATASGDSLDLQVKVPSREAVEALAEPLAVGGFPPWLATDGRPARPEARVGRRHGSADPGRPADVLVWAPDTVA